MTPVSSVGNLFLFESSCQLLLSALSAQVPAQSRTTNPSENWAMSHHGPQLQQQAQNAVLLPQPFTVN